jgi:ribosome-binding protein aMBF1 (putative translation factor)
MSAMKKRYCFNCGKPRNSLHRIKIDASQKWLLVCDNCITQFEKLPQFQEGTNWSKKAD